MNLTHYCHKHTLRHRCCCATLAMPCTFFWHPTTNAQQFLKAAFTFEGEDMDAAWSLLPNVHTAARAADTAAGRRSGWFSSTWGSSSSRGKRVTVVAQLSAVRADVASAGAEVLAALLGLFRLSVSGCVEALIFGPQGCNHTLFLFVNHILSASSHKKCTCIHARVHMIALN